MSRSLIALAILLVSLSACQSVPAERKNNCACQWESFDQVDEGAIA